MISSSATLPLALSLLTSIVPSVQAVYTLQDDYNPSTFLNMFDFFTGADPTNGYVDYLDETTAEVLGLVNTYNNQIYLGVDHSTISAAPGRGSVRLSSTASYNHGLIILDLEHMPGGICGTWPAFWLLGPDWPNNGEVDIIEQVNSATNNQMTLHTNAGCSITSNGLSSGTILETDCNVAADGNVGCGISTTNTQTFGAGFNAIGGGVYATEWTSDAISIWFFPRGAIPSDITSGNPNPANWGLALAEFSGGCDIDAHFKNQQIVFDTTFCGDWAGEVWSSDPVCSTKAATCQDYVQNNPTDFTDAYWAINGLKVYQDSGAAASGTTSAALTTSTSSAATSTSTSGVTTTSPTTLVTSTSTSSFSNTFNPSTAFTSPTSTFTNTLFTSSSIFTNTFFTSTTTFTNTFFTPSTTFSNTYYTAATSAWPTPTTGSSSWGTWGGGQGGGQGGGFGEGRGGGRGGGGF